MGPRTTMAKIENGTTFHSQKQDGPSCSRTCRHRRATPHSATTMPPVSCTSVVRIGPVESLAAQRLREAILSHLGAASDNDQASAAAAATVHVSNRYFRARVRLEDLGTCCHSEELWKEDGMILVFPNDEAEGASDGTVGHKPYGFHSLTAVHEAAAAGGGGELLRLCVGLSEAPLTEHYRATKHYEQQYAQRILWCLDRGYEYVECDLIDLTKGHDERDKEGFARIVEALQGTVWSSAIMEPKKKMELKRSYDQDKPDIVYVGADQQNEYEPPDPSKLFPIGEASLALTTREDKEREEKARKELMGDLENDNAFTGDPTELQPEQGDETLYLAMENALKQASRIRESSRSGTMSDDERRQRAGNAAALLYQLMDQMGFEESEDDEEDESENEDFVEEERLDTATTPSE